LKESKAQMSVPATLVTTRCMCLQCRNDTIAVQCKTGWLFEVLLSKILQNLRLLYSIFHSRLTYLLSFLLLVLLFFPIFLLCYGVFVNKDVCKLYTHIVFCNWQQLDNAKLKQWPTFNYAILRPRYVCQTHSAFHCNCDSIIPKMTRPPNGNL